MIIDQLNRIWPGLIQFTAQFVTRGGLSFAIKPATRSSGAASRPSGGAAAA